MFPLREIKLALHEIEYFGETRNGQLTQMIPPRTIISMGRFVEVVVRGWRFAEYWVSWVKNLHVSFD